MQLFEDKGARAPVRHSCDTTACAQ